MKQFPIRIFIILLLMSCWACKSNKQPEEVNGDSGKPGNSVIKKNLSLKPIKKVNDYVLPEWFDGNRVQGHTRFTDKMMDKPGFMSVADGMETQGAKVFARHFKSSGEPAWWKSKVGRKLTVKNPDMVQTMVDNAHDNGQKILAYYRHIEDRWVANQKKDWVCLDVNGQPEKTQRGAIICLNSPYLDFLSQRLLELVDMGVDGFCFDEMHMPVNGCWCGYCQKKYKEETGKSAPTKMNHQSKEWYDYKMFTNRTMARAFRLIQQRIKQKNPQVICSISSHSWPTLNDLHFEGEFFRYADVSKIEFALPYRMMNERNAFGGDKKTLPIKPGVQYALGYMISRDATEGRPPRVWTHGLLDEKSALAATSGILTHGAVASVDIDESRFPNPDYNSSFEMGDKVSPYMKRTLPLPWVAIHYSEKARDQYIAQPRKAWEKILLPINGVFEALLENHVPISFVLDHQIEEYSNLDSYKYLIVFDDQALSANMKNNIKKFESGGGKVIYIKGGNWATMAGKTKEKQSFLAQYPEIIKEAPAKVETNSAELQMSAFYDSENNRMIVNSTNDFSFVTTRKKKAVKAIERAKKELKTMVIKPCSGNTLRVGAINGKAPVSAKEVLTGKTLTILQKEDGYYMEYPDFKTMSCVVIQY